MILPTPYRLAALLLWLGAATVVSAQMPPAPSREEQTKIAAVEKLLGEIQVKTEAFQKAVPLAHFLHALEKQLPKRISLHLDAEAFGKDFIALASTPVRLPPFPKRMSLFTVLRIALSKIENTPVDYRIGPAEFAITTPQKALYTHTYDIRDLLERSLLLDLLEMNVAVLGEGSAVAEALKDTDGVALLVRLILCEIDPESWSPTAAVPGKIRVVNGTRLVVHTNGTRHGQIEDLLTGIRRLRDLAVVMNARLYEVERAFYARHIAPLLRTGVKEGTVRLAAPVHDAALLKKLKGQPEVVRDGALKIRPSQVTEFLALQEPYRYVVLPRTQGLKGYRTGLAGVSFRVRATVSPDRRSMRLRITQQVAELLEIKKSMALDPATGKECPVESPNVRQNTLIATLTLDDGEAFVMPVDYRPPGGARDRLWILLAEPIIWIEEEQEQLLPPFARPLPKEAQP
jgi:hypothetical protein